MKGKIVMAITIGVICVLLTSFMFVQFKSVEVIEKSGVGLMRETELRTEYTATNNNLSLPLAAEASKPVKVRVEYLQPESSSDLPSQDQTITLTASLYYEDANSQSTQSS